MAIKLFDKVARNQGLVLYLPFMEGAGSSVHDLGKYHNNGTIIGPTWTQLPSGIWVLSLDGVDDHVNCGSDDSLNPDNKTVAAWFKLEGTWDKRIIVGKVSEGGVDNQFGYYIFTGPYNGWMRMGVKDNTKNDRGVNLTGLSHSTWYYAVLVHDYDNSMLYFYLNGEYKGEIGISGWTPYAGILSIGSERGVANYFDGLIGEVRIYNRALSASEVESAFNQDRDLFGV